MYIKISVSVQTRVMGNSNTLFKMAESLQTLKDLLMLIFLCVRIKMICNGSDFLLNISLSVGQS